jgi:hypothetical protein
MIARRTDQRPEKSLGLLEIGLFAGGGSKPVVGKRDSGSPGMKSIASGRKQPRTNFGVA